MAAERISVARRNGFEATVDFTRLKKVDANVIGMPAPVNAYRDPDLSFVIGTTEALIPYLRAGQIVSLESTTYPGTTHNQRKPQIESPRLAVC